MDLKPDLNDFLGQALKTLDTGVLDKKETSLSILLVRQPHRCHYCSHSLSPKQFCFLGHIRKASPNKFFESLCLLPKASQTPASEQ